MCPISSAEPKPGVTSSGKISEPSMPAALNIVAIAIALMGATTFGAAAAPVMASKPTLAALSTNELTTPVSYRRGAWRYDSPCRRGGLFYRYGGGWGCDYYLYGLWP